MVVQEYVSDELPNYFGLVFDGWTMNREHYIAIFATWTKRVGNNEIVLKRLLSCGVQPLPDEDNGENAEDFGLTAEDIGDYVSSVLSLYKKDFGNIEFITGDNASVNKRLCDLMSLWINERGDRRKISLVGCACHRLNLAIKALYLPGTRNYFLIEKVHKLMVELSTLKNSFKLASKTTLNPEIRNDTRWGSTYKMLNKYIELAPILGVCSFKRETLEFIPSEVEKNEIIDLCEILKLCHEYSSVLQTADGSVTMLLCRIALDRLLEQVPELVSHISKDSLVIHNKHFENGIVKIQKGQERTLSRDEKEAVSVFLISHEETNHDDQVEDTDQVEVISLIDQLKRAADDVKKADKPVSKYRSTNHVFPTSVICETLFSYGKNVMTPQRRHMDPSTFEMFMLLRTNSDLYNAITLDVVRERFRQETELRKRTRETETEVTKRLANLEDEIDRDDP